MSIIPTTNTDWGPMKPQPPSDQAVSSGETTKAITKNDNNQSLTMGAESIVGFGQGLLKVEEKLGVGGF